MAMLRGRIAGRWPVAVLAVAGVAALSLGDLVAGWYSWAGRGSSAAGDYPIRIVLRQDALGGGADVLPAGPAGAGAAAGEADEAAAAEGLPEASDEAPAGLRAAQPGLPAARPASDGLLAVRFDLADPAALGGDGGSAIEIRKAIRLNGADAGQARIHVGASSRLSIAREELARLLAGSGQQALSERLGAGERFVSFDEMRRQGIDVRYDPVTDRILVST